MSALEIAKKTLMDDIPEFVHFTEFMVAGFGVLLVGFLVGYFMEYGFRVELTQFTARVRTFSSSAMIE